MGWKFYSNFVITWLKLHLSQLLHFALPCASSDFLSRSKGGKKMAYVGNYLRRKQFSATHQRDQSPLLPLIQLFLTSSPSCFGNDQGLNILISFTTHQILCWGDQIRCKEYRKVVRQCASLNCSPYLLIRLLVYWICELIELSFE